MQTRSEFRPTKFETRADEKQEGGKKLVLRGYAILWNTEATVYDFWAGEIRETIEPTALDETDLDEVYLISGHNIEPDKVLGRTGINLRLEKDDVGLFFEAELPNTQLARDIYNVVECGLVDGMSFGFDHNDEINHEKHSRTITKITKAIVGIPNFAIFLFRSFRILRSSALRSSSRFSSSACALARSSAWRFSSYQFSRRF